MRRSLLSLVVVGMALVSVPGFAQSPTQNFVMPTITHGPFLLSEVYPVTPINLGGTQQQQVSPTGISDNRCFNGTVQTTDNVTVTPGIFCLDTLSDLRLNANAFTSCKPGFNSPYVQSVRLTKIIPGSQKVPDCFPPAQFVQFGPSGIRTWWALKFTQPGTQFILDVTTRCINIQNKRIVEIHIDRWIWEVRVTTQTLPMVIDMLHSSALSIMEFPCIADERVYDVLRQLALLIGVAAQQPEPARTNNVVTLVGLFEGFVLSECTFGEFVALQRPEVPNGFTAPPGNLPSGTTWAPLSFFGNLDPNNPAIQGGILDTIENPCCCKLIADVEFIFNRLIAMSP